MDTLVCKVLESSNNLRLVSNLPFAVDSRLSVRSLLSYYMLLLLISDHLSCMLILITVYKSEPYLMFVIRCDK